ncbi:MAG TPA: alpha/beta hydrolase [Streptosporangiaceae bacterium]|jgi:pimeloyl-ACP methyl ester carboxylesterase|nr:alpha/beta hydrolase [Streptosporangiaceae bacterium]
MPATEFLDLAEGNRLAYDVTGPSDAPLVICTPGMGDHRQVYRFLAPQIVAAGYRVATMDLRGEGESSANWGDYASAASGADLVALARHLGGGGPAVFVSNSYSGAASIVAAADTPEVVAGLAMTGPWTRNPPEAGGIKGLAAKAAIFLAGRITPMWTAYYKSLYKGAKPDDLNGYAKALGASLREPGRMAALRGMMAGGHAAAAAKLASVRCPALIVMGSADPDFPDPAAEAQWIKQQLAGSGQDTEVVMLPGCGHYPIAEAPEPTGQAVLTFLAKVHGA